MTVIVGVEDGDGTAPHVSPINAPCANCGATRTQPCNPACPQPRVTCGSCDALVPQHDALLVDGDWTCRSCLPPMASVAPDEDLLTWGCVLP